MWFIARLLFKAEVKSRLRRKKLLCEESLILISARTEPEARLKATKFAKESQHSYRNVYKEKVSWKFVELQELQQIMSEKLGDGIEVYYKLFYRMADNLRSTVKIASRKARANFKAFDKFMRRRGGKRPRAGDELPRAPEANKKAKK
jgi:hypothetical protein